VFQKKITANGLWATSSHSTLKHVSQTHEEMLETHREMVCGPLGFSRQEIDGDKKVTWLHVVKVNCLVVSIDLYRAIKVRISAIS
jgi:hypothetical protein